MDESALREFVIAEYPRLVAGLEVVFGSRSLAEEAVHEALVRAVEQLRDSREIESLKGWVYAVARNVGRSAFRRLMAERRAQARHRETLVPRDDDATQTDRLAVQMAVRELRPRQREAVALYYFVGFSISEVGTLMQLHPEAVKGLLHRARRQLAVTLSGTRG